MLHRWWNCTSAPGWMHAPGTLAWVYEHLQDIPSFLFYEFAQDTTGVTVVLICIGGAPELFLLACQPASHVGAAEYARGPTQQAALRGKEPRVGGLAVAVREGRQACQEAQYVVDCA